MNGWIIFGVIALTATAVVWGCLRGVDNVSKEEDDRMAMQMQDDRFTAAYWDEHDVSGLIEEE